eukprot:4116753-Prymnesium_polylepis.1
MRSQAQRASRCSPRWWHRDVRPDGRLKKRRTSSANRRPRTAAVLLEVRAWMSARAPPAQGWDAATEAWRLSLFVSGA